MLRCRVDAFVVCEPGTYRLQTGQGPLGVDPNCGSPHCELLNQTTLATLQVVNPELFLGNALDSCLLYRMFAGPTVSSSNRPCWPLCKWERSGPGFGMPPCAVMR